MHSGDDGSNSGSYIKQILIQTCVIQKIQIKFFFFCYIDVYDILVLFGFSFDKKNTQYYYTIRTESNQD